MAAMSDPTLQFDSQDMFKCGKCGEHWCKHISDWLDKGMDSSEIHAGDKIFVPVLPTEGIFVYVHINRHTLFNGAAEMRMEYHPDFGPRYDVPLGYWNPGEGRMSIRAVIIDYMKSQCHVDEDFDSSELKTKCPSSSHGFRAEFEIQHKVSLSVKKKRLCCWHIVMEKACTPCIEESIGGDETSDNFGLDGAILRRSNSGGVARQSQPSQIVHPSSHPFSSGGIVTSNAGMNIFGTTAPGPSRVDLTREIIEYQKRLRRNQ